MATDNHTPPVAPQPLGYSEAFELLDAVMQAKSRLKGTIALMSIVIDSDRPHDEDAVLTLERHIQNDVASLDAICDVAWEKILSPLHAVVVPDGPSGQGDAA